MDLLTLLSLEDRIRLYNPDLVLFHHFRNMSLISGMRNGIAFEYGLEKLEIERR
jgi:hypothetical protein